MGNERTTHLTDQSHAFLKEDFLLQSEVARKLYFDHAAKQPIIDYHNHLNPQQVAVNHHFENITELWLEGDHYKWRALRAHGVNENFITGSASPEEKFEQWAATVPFTMMNPLYHWTHMELWNPFGIGVLLQPSNAKEVYDRTGHFLKAHGARDLLKHFKVTHLCTTDDPVDSLEWHKLQASEEGPQMYPTFRADNAVNIEKGASFVAYVESLGEVVGNEITTFELLLGALQQRHDYFASHGCRVSDHGLERFHYAPASASEVEAIFKKAMAAMPLTTLEIEKYKSALLLELARLDARSGWVQQFHVGALRDNNGRLNQLLGADVGCDSIGDESTARPMSRFLDTLDQEGLLAKTITYNLNPADNDLYAAMMGNYNDGSLAGKMQYGAAWWFLDQLDGMEAQLKTLSNYGLLAHFVGMLTDSRSFLSFSRHEYFRRLLCNFLGEAMDQGKLPNDQGFIGGVIEAICYTNAKNYFGFE